MARQYYVNDDGTITSTTGALPPGRTGYQSYSAAAQSTEFGPYQPMPQPGNPNNPASANYGVGQNGGWPVPPADQYANWPGPGWFWNGSSWQQNLTAGQSYNDWVNGGAAGWEEEQAYQAALAAGVPYYPPNSGGDGTSSIPGGGGQAAYSATPTSPSPGPGYIWDGFKWVEDPAVIQERKNAAELLNKKFAEFGISGLAPQIEAWLKAGYSADTIALMIRDTPQYQQRFPAMKELAQRGMALSEAEYIAQERQYRAVFTSYGVPASFYDQPDDYAGFMLNDVSAAELDQRVWTAQTFMQSSQKEYMDALGSYYGVSPGTALAYLLDPKKAQDVLRREIRTAELGGAAAQDGFNLSREQAAKYAGTSIGQTLDPFNAQTMAALEDTFGKAREFANLDSTLTRLEGSAYDQMDAVDIAFGDTQKSLASQKRAQREQARFANTSGVGRTSLAARAAQG